MSNSTTTAVRVPAMWAMHLPPRTGAALIATYAAGVIDTRDERYAAAGAAAGLIPGLYSVKGYTTKAGDKSMHVTAAHAATDAALKVRQAERKLAAARAALATAPALPKAPKAGKGKGKGKGK